MLNLHISESFVAPAINAPHFFFLIRALFSILLCFLILVVAIIANLCQKISFKNRTYHIVFIAFATIKLSRLRYKSFPSTIIALSLGLLILLGIGLAHNAFVPLLLVILALVLSIFGLALSGLFAARVLLFRPVLWVLLSVVETVLAGFE